LPTVVQKWARSLVVQWSKKTALLFETRLKAK
jgi:hypothetical protein